MRIYIATDHTGIELKNKIKTFLDQKGHEVEDCGAYEFDKNDDYPDFIGKAAEGVSKNEGSIGFIFGGSGQGEQMTANKSRNVRCALFYSPAVAIAAVDITGKKSTDPFEIIKLTRDHNHANMLSFGMRFLQEEDIFKAIEVFISTPWSKESRHIRRVNKIKKLENGSV